MTQKPTNQQTISDQIKHDLFLYITMLAKCLEINFESTIRLLSTLLNKSWKHFPTKQPLYGHVPPTSQTIQISRTMYV